MLLVSVEWLVATNRLTKNSVPVLLGQRSKR